MICSTSRHAGWASRRFKRQCAIFHNGAYAAFVHKMSLPSPTSPSSGLGISPLIEGSNKIGIGELWQLLQLFAGILQFQYPLCVFG